MGKASQSIESQISYDKQIMEKKEICGNEKYYTEFGENK